MSYLFDQKFQLTYPYASIKDTQATRKSFSPQQRTSSPSKHEISLFFLFFLGNFCPHESGSGFRTPDPDPDPLTCLKSGSTTLAKTMCFLSSKLLYSIKMINKHYNSDEKAYPTHTTRGLQSVNAFKLNSNYKLNYQGGGTIHNTNICSVVLYVASC